ncbi:sugar phosphate nucleotidyltransferase, partial [candidate division KSB1 bacterium]
MTEKSRIVGIIPAAGKGSRLAPFPCPKELFPVGYQDFETEGTLQKRPKVISQYLTEQMAAAGAGTIFFVLGEDKWDIARYYGDGSQFGVDIAYLYQAEPKGLPFALDLARPWIDQKTVVFGMPDTIIEPDDVFRRLLAAHNDNANDLTLGLFPTDTPSKFGMVSFDSSQKFSFTIDKPKESDLEYMWGIAAWGPGFTEFQGRYLKDVHRSRWEAILGDVFNAAKESGLKIGCAPFADGKYMDIGTADELDR